MWAYRTRPAVGGRIRPAIKPEAVEMAIARSIAMFGLLCKVAILALACSPAQGLLAKPRWDFPSDIDVLSLGVRELQQYLSSGKLTSVQLVQKYLVSRSA